MDTQPPASSFQLPASLYRPLPRPILRSALRVLIALLALAAVGLALLALALPRLPALNAAPPLPAATPPPPAILAPAGPLPHGPGGLVELAQYAGRGYAPVGSGFLLGLPDGTVLGATTAHSVGSLGRPGHRLQGLAFALPGQFQPVAKFHALYGAPGRPRTGRDLSVDYVLLRLEGTVDPALVLQPDPRGGPQPGERAALYGQGRVAYGTVIAAESTGAWVLMDETFEPGGYSGSPLLSAHTGQVVGMAIAAARRGDRLLIGFHPVASLLAHALAANSFPPIAGYQAP